MRKARRGTRNVARRVGSESDRGVERTHESTADKRGLTGVKGLDKEGSVVLAGIVLENHHTPHMRRVSVCNRIAHLTAKASIKENTPRFLQVFN